MSGETAGKMLRALKNKLVPTLKAVFGFVGRDSALPGDGATEASTLLAIHRTDLALDRTYLASERTLLGWIRTALSMISFGFTLGKLGQALQQIEVKGILGIERTVSITSMAYLFVVLGTLGLFIATVQFRLHANELQALGLRRHYSVAMLIGVLLTVGGGFAFTALVMNL